MNDLDQIIRELVNQSRYGLLPTDLFDYPELARYQKSQIRDGLERLVEQGELFIGPGWKLVGQQNFHRVL